MKLSKEELDDFRLAKSKYESTKDEVAHAALEEKAVLSRTEYYTNQFLEAFEAFKEIQSGLIKEHGEGVKFNLETGEITKPK